LARFTDDREKATSSEGLELLGLDCAFRGIVSTDFTAS
jgi:hypothetical protein